MFRRIFAVAQMRQNPRLGGHGFSGGGFTNQRAPVWGRIGGLWHGWGCVGKRGWRGIDRSLVPETRSHLTQPSNSSIIMLQSEAGLRAIKEQSYAVGSLPVQLCSITAVPHRVLHRAFDDQDHEGRRRIF